MACWLARLVLVKKRCYRNLCRERRLIYVMSRTTEITMHRGRDPLTRAVQYELNLFNRNAWFLPSVLQGLQYERCPFLNPMSLP